MQRKPEWIKSKFVANEKFSKIKKVLRTLNLNTVCVEAKCPNLGECWGHGTATFLILGDICTRNCKFCATKTGNPNGIADWDEPERVLQAVKEMELSYVVITSVTRDDLEDHGAEIYAKTVELIKKEFPEILVEVLVPDLRANPEHIKRVLDSGVDVFAHNVEVVKRLTPRVRDKRASYEISLKTLELAKKLNPDVFTKSGFMIGLGENVEEITKTMKDLKEVGVNFLTIGQYLQPTPSHLTVEKYYSPQEFKELEKIGLEMGFEYVATGPLVRSSYMAGEFFIRALKKQS